MTLKRIYFALALASITFSVQAQTKIKVQTKDGFKYFVSDTSNACNKKLIFARVEASPSYQGGCKALETELNEKLEINKDIQGDLRIWLVINCEAEAYGVQFFNDLDDDLQEQLVKFLETHQNWTAGQQGGENVDCEFVLNLRVRKGKVKILNKC